MGKVENQIDLHKKCPCHPTPMPCPEWCFGGIFIITNGSGSERGLMSAQDSNETVPFSFYPGLKK